MAHLTINQDFLKETISQLEMGKTMLYPTDTIWGIGCDATNEEAIKKIYSIKAREEDKPMLVLVCDDAMLNKYVDEVPEMAWDIIDLSTKPTTIIYPKARNLAKNLIAKDGSIGIRMIKEGFCYELLRKYRKPIVSTSANFSGEPSPKHFSEISNELKQKIDFIIPEKYNSSVQNQSSSIIKIELDGQIKVIRK